MGWGRPRAPGAGEPSTLSPTLPRRRCRCGVGVPGSIRVIFGEPVLDAPHPVYGSSLPQPSFSRYRFLVRVRGLRRAGGQHCQPPHAVTDGSASRGAPWNPPGGADPLDRLPAGGAVVRLTRCFSFFLPSEPGDRKGRAGWARPAVPRPCSRGPELARPRAHPTALWSIVGLGAGLFGVGERGTSRNVPLGASGRGHLGSARRCVPGGRGIMPPSGLCRCRIENLCLSRVFGWRGRHNHRLSKKARRASGGR
jgi:hypothetical protein